MRGYEIDRMKQDLSIITSYESPCGVMSEKRFSLCRPCAQLRIPMRGYEDTRTDAVRSRNQVTNPHAGL